jgi:hypothetical protein
MQQLPQPINLTNKIWERAGSVSADGSKVIGSTTNLDASTGATIAIWTESVGTSLLTNADGTYVSSPSGGRISADGSTVTGTGNRLYHLMPQAWRWTESGGYAYLEPQVANSQKDGSRATDISADGSMIVGTLFRENRQSPMIWDAQHGVRFLDSYFVNELGLDLTGWTIDTIVGISDDGRTFFGRGINPTGEQEFWVVRNPQLLGDYDFDGDVDGADFVVWQTSFPTSGDLPNLPADGDGDGDVDGADFVIWQTHFPYTPNPNSVPEPLAFFLLLVALPWLAFAKCRAVLA